MNILLVNHYAGSKEHGMEFRPYYMAREWVKQGHNVTIIASTFSHLRQVNPTVEKDFQEDDIDGIKYVWLKGNAYEGSIARIRNIGSFVWKLQRNACKIAKTYKPDLVIASSTYPLDNVPAHRIAKLAGAKHCYEAHDIWPLSPIVIGGYSKYHPFIVVMQWAENYACRKADKVISLLWNSKEHYHECGLAPGKFACVPNGYCKEDWTPELRASVLPEEHKKAFLALNGKVVVGFAGGHVASGALDTLVDAAILMKDEQSVHFVLVGKGPEKEHLIAKAKDAGLTNITFLPPVPKKLIPALNGHFDIGYMGGVHSALHIYGTSYNKMIDYMLSGIPMIQAIDEPGCVVEQTSCGVQVEAENPGKVVEAIRGLIDMTPAQRYEMGEKGKRYAEENLEWSILCERFLEDMC